LNKDTKQLSLLEEYKKADNGPVVCLGNTFENDVVRREYFRDELRKKLPELRKIEGFPVGNDEDIILMSDPPYYTVCPNPWISDFVEEWEKEKVANHDGNINEEYNREPFTGDVSEGKADPLYLAHSYHTKVPHRAIMKYILHYTNPGDIIYDGFCGTGMTGVAAQLCGDKSEIEKLGYTIKDNQDIYDEDSNFVSKLGSRKAILNDLAPAATFISSNLNNKKDIELLTAQALKSINEVEEELSWFYETAHEEDKQATTKKGTVNYILWSDVFICQNCSNEIIYWDIAVDEDNLSMKKELHCNHCCSVLNKRNLKRSFVTKYDDYLMKVISQAKQVPVLINYVYNKKKYFKKPDKNDLEIIKKIGETNLEVNVPIDELPQGFNTKQPINSHGFTHTHHFYTRRNLFVLSSLWNKAKENPILKFCLTAILVKTGSNLHNVGLKNGKINLAGALPNVLYIPSILAERNIFILLKGKVRDVSNAEINRIRDNNIISTSSFGTHNLENVFDYIFIDPPFGANLMYSELNFIWESWHKVFTENTFEAIENKVQNKSLEDYGQLMKESLKKAYRLLKPDRWITIEFSNTSAAVWNIIQRSVQEAGFVIANVSALNKGQGTYFAQTNPTSVKQDLIITAYKPSSSMINNIKNSNRDELESSAWVFIQNHLSKLPVFAGTKGEAQIIAERTPRILFDRMIAYHIQNGLPVPISSGEFQAGVIQRFPMRDGMAFLENQVVEYDRKRILIKEFVQMNLFVSDENSAIEWIRQQLMKKPQTRQDLHPIYMKEIQHIAKHELLPELDNLLQQNFLRYEDEGLVPDQIVSYIRRNFKELRGLEGDNPALIEKAKSRWYVPDPNKQADLEKLREKALLREFEGYLEELEKNKKKLKQFRTEAIRVGFKKAYSNKDFEVIVQLGERLPESVIQEDDKLLMYYDNACIRLGI